jgi:hypothetical protein
MPRLWYIQINGKREGPYSVQELKKDTRITPDTLVWMEGFPEWVPVRMVPELAEIFEDDESIELTEKFKKKEEEVIVKDDVLAIRSDPPNLYIWLFIIFIIALYLFYVFH